jgi:hypothetical protein
MKCYCRFSKSRESRNEKLMSDLWIIKITKWRNKELETIDPTQAGRKAATSALRMTRPFG